MSFVYNDILASVAELSCIWYADLGTCAIFSLMFVMLMSELNAQMC